MSPADYGMCFGVCIGALVLYAVVGVILMRRGIKGAGGTE